MTRLPSAAVAAALALAVGRSGRTQGTEASLEARVVTAAGAPVADAEVRVRNLSNGFATSGRTDARGRTLFSQLPLGGPYTVAARRIGYVAAAKTGYHLTLGSRATVTLELRAAAQELTAVVVIDAGATNRRQRLGGSTRIGSAELATLPVQGRNFTDLVALSPLAGAEFSIAGQRATSTDVRIDGLQARNMLRGGELGRGPYTISLEAVREFETVTNVYDVTQGRQGGGSIDAVTRFGTNTLTASVFLYHRDDALTAPHDYLGRPRDLRQLTLYQFGGSVGGPIVRDRLHYFVAFDRQQSREPLAIDDLRSAQDQVEAGVAADSLQRFLEILRAKYGLPAESQQVGVFQRRPVANTFFLRLDWELSERHRLTLRNNFSDFDSPQNGVGDQLNALFESRSSSRSVDDETLISIRSSLGNGVQNELKLGFSLADRALTPNTTIPRGFVRVRSALPNGTTGDARLQFGGNRLAPERSGEREYQLVNTTYWQRGSHLVTVGTDNALTFLRTFIPTDEGGLFEFNSLGALDSLVAARYSRQVPLGEPPYARQYVLDGGLFAQDEWRPGASLTATVGIRWDVTSFVTAARRNPLVEQRFGLRTDNTPTDWNNLQPRAQVVWDPGGNGSDVVRLGAGAFAAQPHYYLQANDIFFDGTRLADLTLTGAAVPTPDFRTYRQDLSSVPGVPPDTPAPAYVNLISKAFQTPTVWKGSIAYQHRFGERLTVGGTLLYTRTVNNYQYFDRNLRDQPAFRLANERDRAVFVPAVTIDAQGRPAAQNAYKDPAFTHVLELVSTGEATQRTAIADVALDLARGASLRGSYTYNRAADNSTFSCCIARTASLLTPVASDPRDLSGSHGPSDYDFRHKLVLFGELPEWAGVRAGIRYVGSSGRPFSLVVNGDINGDDYSGNDLAFIFDPHDPATDPAVGAGILAVMSNTRSVARDYVRRNLGRIAPRNGGAAPWGERVDVRVAKSFAIAGSQRAELIADVYNVANLLNARWGGQYLLPQGISASNPTTQQLALLNVVGFDQATGRYRYTVNENVGVLRKRGDPYQIQLGVRYSF